MKYSCLLLACCFSISLLHAQDIKKIRIDDLEQYIQQSRKPLVINFWATYCKPCLEELPAIFNTAKQYPGIELVLVSLDLPDFFPGRLKTFVNKQPLLPATHFWLDETNADAFCPKIDSSWTGAIPVTLFIHSPKQFRQFFATPMSSADISQAFSALDAATH